MKYGENEPYLNHCIVRCCSEVPGAVIESVSDERSVLTNWANIINKRPRYYYWIIYLVLIMSLCSDEHKKITVKSLS